MNRNIYMYSYKLMFDHKAIKINDILHTTFGKKGSIYNLTYHVNKHFTDNIVVN